jgi:hypothetical protein
VSYKFNPFTGTFDDVGPNNGNGVPGGSTTQVQFNDGGVFGGVANSSVDNATGNITLGSRFISSLNGAASAPPGIFTGTWFTGGTATTTKPQVLIEPTGATSTAWSTSGTGLGVNAASGFAGQLLDLQLNGSTRFVVTSAGKLGSYGGIYDGFIDFATDSGRVLIGRNDLGSVLAIGSNVDIGMTLASNSSVGWSSSGAVNGGNFNGDYLGAQIPTLQLPSKFPSCLMATPITTQRLPAV